MLPNDFSLNLSNETLLMLYIVINNLPHGYPDDSHDDDSFLLADDLFPVNNNPPSMYSPPAPAPGPTICCSCSCGISSPFKGNVGCIDSSNVHNNNPNNYNNPRPNNNKNTFISHTLESIKEEQELKKTLPKRPRGRPRKGSFEAKQQDFSSASKRTKME